MIGGLFEKKDFNKVVNIVNILQLQTQFVLQKFISPSDRDEIVHWLGISGVQVATWFRNRRVKRRREL